MSSDTPMMKQYKRIKKRYPDSILFFRLGDFYEMFYEDANVASEILGIALTSRNKNDDNPVPLCGVPYHSVEPYLAKLLGHGHKVAICEQVEDPKHANGVVDRKVVKVLTPGAIVDSENLDSKSNNYLASIYSTGESWGLSFADISTGEFRTTSFSGLDDLRDELFHLEPKEFILPENLRGNDELCSYLGTRDSLITEIDPWVWEFDTAKDILKNFLSVRTLEGFGLDEHPESVISSGALVHYIRETQMADIPPIDPPSYYTYSDYLLIDESTKRNLEVQRTIRTGTKKGSLLWVLDETLTAMGGRLLKRWINYPLIDVKEIEKRLDAVEELKHSPGLRRDLRDVLKEIRDIERLIGRICTTSAKPRDLGALRDSSRFISKLKEISGEFESGLLSQLSGEIDDLSDIREMLEEALIEDPPATSRDGGIIKDGFSAELDELKTVTREGKKWISDLESEERKSTGIGSLKVGFNKIYGYYIEVTKANMDSVPDDYIRKQTLTNSERYITPELKEYEEKILGAEEKILDLEKELFEKVRSSVAEKAERVRHTASRIASLDVLTSLSEAADKYGYIKPKIENSEVIELRESRHPVIERMELEERFVPNDLRMDRKENQFLIITGPNMAGKSTLIRQVALIVLMAQMGGFVPAVDARIGTADRIFTRVGASDNLARGQSTFMVEMVETAYILRHSTKKSLVVLDEIGRGTSTFDGMSIAWAVSEYLHDRGCRTLFATHYHELAHLALSKRKIKNYNIYVKEDGEKIVFLRKLIPGAASHSYGIQVAGLAGVPEKVIKSARKILRNLEKSRSALTGSIKGGQMGLFVDAEDAEPGEEKENGEKEKILSEIREMDPTSMTPLEALTKLAEIRERLVED